LSSFFLGVRNRSGSNAGGAAMTAMPVPQQSRPGPLARIAAFVDAFSIEVTRPSPADVAALDALKRGTRVYLSAVAGRPAQETIANARHVRSAGFEPIPHVAVRHFASSQALDDFLARLNGEAAVERVLVIAGDRAECGPYRNALDAIDSGVLRRRGIRSIGIAGYPDGHPRIGADELSRALTAKIAAAEATGLSVEVVTQFCFDAGAILKFVGKLRAFGIEHPLRIGLAGPTSLTSLMRYASRCGVRASAAALAQRAGLIRQMFAMATPDDLLRALADAAPGNITPHFFSFGGIGPTARWARAVANGRITLQGDGFKVDPPPV
jgi:methylenetetrahydrofolate reductase (NADPH)